MVDDRFLEVRELLLSQDAPEKIQALMSERDELVEALKLCLGRINAYRGAGASWSVEDQTALNVGYAAIRKGRSDDSKT